VYIGWLSAHVKFCFFKFQTIAEKTAQYFMGLIFAAPCVYSHQEKTPEKFDSFRIEFYLFGIIPILFVTRTWVVNGTRVLPD